MASYPVLSSPVLSQVCWLLTSSPLLVLRYGGRKTAPRQSFWYRSTALARAGPELLRADSRPKRCDRTVATALFFGRCQRLSVLGSACASEGA
jgi:hypothetical protein